MRGVLCVEIVILATSASVMLVRRGDLQNLDPGALHEAERTSAIAPGRFNADALDVSENASRASICRYP